SWATQPNGRERAFALAREGTGDVEHGVPQGSCPGGVLPVAEHHRAAGALDLFSFQAKGPAGPRVPHLRRAGQQVPAISATGPATRPRSHRGSRRQSRPRRGPPPAPAGAGDRVLRLLSLSARLSDVP